MRYFTTYENSRTKRAQKKACFLLILRISKSPSVAMCCLNVDLYLSFHKHTPKLPLALSRLSRSLLDRFLNDKTWFFVFSTLYARWVTKGLNRCSNETHQLHNVRINKSDQELQIFFFSVDIVISEFCFDFVGEGDIFIVVLSYCYCLV